MNLLSRYVALFSLSLAAGGWPAHAQQRVKDAVAQIQRERIQASYLIAFGRKATDDEVKYWSGQNPKSVSELVDRHRVFLKQDKATREDAIRRSYRDAFGTNPNQGELNHWMGRGENYTEMVKLHVERFRTVPADQDATIRRSYQNVLGRTPADAEIKYWKTQGLLSYAVLAACHEDWKSRGGEKNQRTSGTPTLAANTNRMVTVPVTVEILKEARAAAGLIGNDGGSMVAAGAGNMVAAGGLNMVAAGAGN